MKCLFYCDTLYQLMTILNVISEEEKKCKCDLVVYHNFKKSHEYVSNLEKYHIFEKIYNILPEKETVFEETKGMIFARKYLRERGFDRLDYDTLYAASLDTVVSLDLYSTVRYQKFILFDDGIGSYFYNILGGDYMSIKRLAVLKFFHPLRKYFDVSELLVYSPELCESSAASYKRKIKMNFDESIDSIFLYRPNELYKEKTVFIEQPCTFRELYKYREEADAKLKAVLEECQEVNWLIRLHPRMEKSKVGSNIDTISNLWELECKNQIDETNTLLAIHSTAIFQPTIMFGKFPRMILLFELFKQALSENEYVRIKEFTAKFVRAYSQSKVFVPKTFKELRMMLLEQ